MSAPKHPKDANPPRDDLENDPGIGRSKGRYARTDEPPLDGDNTYEGDVGNDATAEGGVDPKQRGRENK